MTIKIEIPEELAAQMVIYHLETGLRVQTYINAAIRFFSFVKEQEDGGKAVGYGDKGRFSSYNTVASPNQYLLNEPSGTPLKVPLRVTSGERD